MASDPDKLFSYNTKQQVNVHDRTLGLMEKTVQLSVALYVILFVFVNQEGYLEHEHARGQLQTFVDGNVVSTSTGGTPVTRHFAADEIVYPRLENGNVFIATKVMTMQQERGVCEDLTMFCSTPEDCSKDVGATCSENGYCSEPAWCPVNPEEPLQVFKLDTAMLRIWVKSTISFGHLKKGRTYFYSTSMDAPVLFPAPGFNTFMLRDLLLACDPPVRFEEVSELGAAIQVQFIWDCKVDNMFGCVPKLKARRVDSLLNTDKIGFSYKKADQDTDGKRFIEERNGIRIYFSTAGTGSQVSPSAIIFKMSTGAALLAFAPMITDFMMLHVLKQSRKYRARKYIISEDFSDFFDKLNLEAGGGEDNELEQEEEVEYEQADEQWRTHMNEEDA